MRVLVFLLVLITVFSCQTIHYLSDPIKGYPNTGLLTNPNSNGILVATNYNLMIDTTYLENCMEGFRLNIGAKSELKIIDEIYFNKCPDAAILMELKEKYKVDGLLLMTKLRVRKQSYEVPSKRLYLVHESHSFARRSDENDEHPPHYTTVPWTNLYVEILSKWEYHDFTTEKSYEFSVKNEKVIEFEQYVANVDTLLVTNFNLLNPIFYENGKTTAYRLVGLENQGIGNPVAKVAKPIE